jgi:hypothetical protein
VAFIELGKLIGAIAGVAATPIKNKAERSQLVIKLVTSSYAEIFDFSVGFQTSRFGFPGFSRSAEAHG